MIRIRIKFQGSALMKPEIYRFGVEPKVGDKININDGNIYKVLEVIHFSEDDGFDVGLLITYKKSWRYVWSMGIVTLWIWS